MKNQLMSLITNSARKLPSLSTNFCSQFTEFNSMNTKLILTTVIACNLILQANPVKALTLTIESDPGDGAIAQDDSPSGGGPPTPNAGSTSATFSVGIFGTLSASTRRKGNVIYFFELPDLDQNDILAAEFSFPLRKINDKGGMNFSIDAWGLGFVSTPTIDPFWLNASNTDPNPGLGITNRVKIQDNIMTRNTPDPNFNPVDITTNATGNTNLLGFIQSLYDAGAGAGDYAIIRLNHDFDQNPDSNGTPQFSVGLNEATFGSPNLTLEVEEQPEKIPESSSPLSLLAIGIGGVALTLKRKLKSTKSPEKQTEKIS